MSDQFENESIRFILIFGQEGAGKTTITKSLVHHIPYSVAIDAEDLALINPWKHDSDFLKLLALNVFSLSKNYYAAGYKTIIAGSFFDTYEDYSRIKTNFPKNSNVTILQLSSSKTTRDIRRKSRNKQYIKEESDWVDENFPEDSTFSVHTDEYNYIRVVNDYQTLEETIAYILNRLSPLIQTTI